MKLLLSSTFSLFFLMLFSCGSEPTDNNEVLRQKVSPFDLADVTLLDGPFKHATELNVKSLLRYELWFQTLG